MRIGLVRKKIEKISSKSIIICVYTDMKTHQSMPIPEFRKEHLSYPPLENEAIVGENPEKA